MKRLIAVAAMCAGVVGCSKAPNYGLQVAPQAPERYAGPRPLEEVACDPIHPMSFKSGEVQYACDEQTHRYKVPEEKALTVSDCLNRQPNMGSLDINDRIFVAFCYGVFKSYSKNHMPKSYWK